MNAWYNEIDPYAAQWLENLATAGHVAAGAVERRSVRDLRADDIPSDRQCHFFAGIGGWSAALRLADWPDDLPVWTGSCPCQPFSAAGKGRGLDDERHLWPVWFDLIRECRPSIIFGEQVASPAGLTWFDAVSADLEGAGYAVGAADLCAASVGAPHIRQRLYFVAVAQRARNENARSREINSSSSGMQKANGERERLWSDPWERCDLVPCLDGKRRPVEPGVFPLANGFPARVGQIRAYGNTINPQLAATFIQAARDWIA